MSRTVLSFQASSLCRCLSPSLHAFSSSKCPPPAGSPHPTLPHPSFSPRTLIFSFIYRDKPESLGSPASPPPGLHSSSHLPGSGVDTAQDWFPAGFLWPPALPPGLGSATTGFPTVC